ncbi:MAG: hypothetical protein HPY61_01855 [Methanotrichaceae archaeon]|nr:hypothetical protein [Methanotrichaceae archaeon]
MRFKAIEKWAIAPAGKERRFMRPTTTTAIRDPPLPRGRENVINGIINPECGPGP